MAIRAPLSAMRRKSRQFARDERGAIIVMLAVSMTALLLTIGLAVDVGWWYTLQRQNQSAADAAAVSAAYRLAARLGAGQASTPADLQPAANLAAATVNGYTGAAAAVDYPFQGNNGRVRARLAQDQNTWFASLAALNSVTVGTSAVAQVDALAPGCVLSLSQNANYGIYVQGSAQILAPDCTLISDSKSPNSVFLHDNGANITAATVVTAGEVSGHVNAGTFSVTFPEQTGAAVVPDPYAATLTHAALVPSAAIINTACIKTVAGGVTTWGPPGGPGGCTVIPAANCPKKNPPPNCFNEGEKLSGNTRIAGDWSPTSSIVLPAGTYWMTDGDLTVKNVTISCAGCTIIMTTVTNSKIGYVATSANGNLNLTAPNAGVFAGTVLIQDSVAGVNIDTCTIGPDNFGMCLNANAAPQLSGLVYFPKSDVGFQGTPVLGGPQCLILVSNTVQLSGNPTFKTSGCAGLGLDPNQLTVKTVALIQ